MTRFDPQLSCVWSDELRPGKMDILQEKMPVPELDLSVIIPVFNEKDSIVLLLNDLIPVLKETGKSFEVIFVDDGSTDGSASILAQLCDLYPEVKVIQFRRNAGQTAALMAGFDHAYGEVIVTLDADMQNDPRDIPILLAELDVGADVVSGWRKDRKDDRVKRTLISKIANRIISKVSGVELHDFGCTLKAYRKEMLQGMRLYGEMHRFVPIYASWMGAVVVEIPVRHHPRKYGQSKYGLNRTFKVMLDLIVIQFLSRWLTKPIYFFGGFGFLCILLGGAALFYALYLKFFGHLTLIQTPLPLLSALLVLIGMTSIMLGILAEIIVRTYFESQGRRNYAVKKFVNFEQDKI